MILPGSWGFLWFQSRVALPFPPRLVESKGFHFNKGTMLGATFWLVPEKLKCIKQKSASNSETGSGPYSRVHACFLPRSCMRLAGGGVQEAALKLR